MSEVKKQSLKEQMNQAKQLVAEGLTVYTQQLKELAYLKKL